MSNNYFSFKQFTVNQDACAMKVGTDGVLLGAWTRLALSVTSILDVGCGTGLIALMLAQRCRAPVTAIDIDDMAVCQARDNFLRSPWHDSMTAIQGDFITMPETGKYDVIVSNPPFFKNALDSPDEHRSMARNNFSLSYPDLISKVSRMLSDAGHFSLIVPSEYEPSLRALSVANGLYVSRCTRVRTKACKPVTRVLMDFTNDAGALCEENELILLDDSGSKSSDYVTLTGEYYINC